MSTAAISLVFATILSGAEPPSRPTLKALLCDGCMAHEEERRALGEMSNGYLFVYNVDDNRIRKFEVVTAPTPSSTQAASQRDAVGATKVVSEPVDPPAGSKLRPLVRELWEYPVDENVRKIFDSLVRVESRSPGTLVQGREHEAITQDR